MQKVRIRAAVHMPAKTPVQSLQDKHAPLASTFPDMHPFMLDGGMSSGELHVAPYFPSNTAAGEAAVPSAKPVRKHKAAAKTAGKTGKKSRSKTGTAGTRTAKSATRKPRSPKTLAAAKAGTAKVAEAKPRKRRAPASTKTLAAAPESLQPDIPVAAAVVLALPQEAEPLAIPPVQLTGDIPLPRSVALAPYRKGSFLDIVDMVGFWLRGASRRAATRLLARKPRKKSARPRLAARPAEHQPAARQDEVAALRADNERLRQQLEALLARQEGPAG